MYACNIVILFEISSFVRVEIIERSDEIEIPGEAYTACCIETFAFHTPVFSGKIFRAQIKGGSGDNPSCTPAFLGVIFSGFNSGIFRICYGMSCSADKRTTYG